MTLNFPPTKISGKLDYVAEFLIAGEGPAMNEWSAFLFTLVLLNKERKA